MRRSLRFRHLNEAIAESSDLLKSGYTMSGNWTLAQICCHLRISIVANMKGYPLWMTVLGYPLRPFVRHFMLDRLLSGDSPKGVRTAGMFVPPEGLDDAEEFEKFAKCVRDFLGYEGSLHGHPGFGNMSKDGFTHFHAAHSAHHLSFLNAREITEKPTQN